MTEENPSTPELTSTESNLTEEILTILENEANGMLIEQIAEKTGKTPINIYVWFSKYGKASEIDRVHTGQIALRKFAKTAMPIP